MMIYGCRFCLASQTCVICLLNFQCHGSQWKFVCDFTVYIHDSLKGMFVYFFIVLEKFWFANTDRRQTQLLQANDV